MSTNVTLLNPIEQIQIQKLEATVYTEERSYFEADLTLCECDEVSIDVNLELYLDYHPGWNQSYVTRIKAHLLSAYDHRECEDIDLSVKEKKQLEKYISENLNIQIN